MLKRGPAAHPLRFRGHLAIAGAAVTITWLWRGDRVFATGAGFLAAILLFTSCAMLVRAAAKNGGWVNGYTLVLATFVITYPVSALVHLTGTDYVPSGFYDFGALDQNIQGYRVYLSLALVLLAQVGLWYGLAPSRPHPESRRSGALRVHPRLLVVAGACFTLIGIMCTFLFFRGQGGSIADMTTVDRGRDIAVGTARYAFMSAWLSWGVTFLLSAFLASCAIDKRPKLTIAALLAGSGCILFNMLWTGGRAENLLAIAPLIFMVRRCARPIFRPFAFTMALLIVALIAFETLARMSGFVGAGLDYLDAAGVSRGEFVSNQVAAILDWQMGRYATIGLILDMSRHFGFAMGSTLLQGIAITVNAPATLLHLGLKIPEPQAITSVAGEYLFSDPDINGVVPGTVAELYFNFGVVGVLGGFYIIGRIARMCIRILAVAGDLGTILLGFYSLLLICIWTIPMTATLTLYFLVTRGLPILALYAIERALCVRAKQDPKDARTLSQTRCPATP